jgi:copper chaperone CopZ
MFKRHKMQDQKERSQEPAKTGPKDKAPIAPQAPPNVWRLVDKNREFCNFKSLEEQDKAENIAHDAPNKKQDYTANDNKNAESEIDSLLASCRIEEPLVDELYTFVLHIGGMTCSGCERVVRSTLETLADIASVVVNWRLATATIECPVPRLDLSAVVSALDAVGMRVYMAPSAALKSTHCADSISAAEGCENESRDSIDGINKLTNAISALSSGRLSPDDNDDKFRVSTGASPLGFFEFQDPQETSLSLLDDLLVRSESKLRRFECRCGCGGIECICSPHAVNAEDPGQGVSRSALCSRLETNLSSTNNSKSSLWSLLGTQPSTSVEERTRNNNGVVAPPTIRPTSEPSNTLRLWGRPVGNVIYGDVRRCQHKGSNHQMPKKLLRQVIDQAICMGEQYEYV